MILSSCHATIYWLVLTEDYSVLKDHYLILYSIQRCHD